MINQVLNAVRRFGATWTSNAVLAANTPITVVAPAANVNGMIVHRANISNYSTVFTYQVLVAKVSAPASITDGDVILSTALVGYNNTYYFSAGQADSDIYIPPGKGLYVIAAGATASAFNTVAYTLF